MILSFWLRLTALRWIANLRGAGHPILLGAGILRLAVPPSRRQIERLWQSPELRSARYQVSAQS
jgi:hypothetical protein